MTVYTYPHIHAFLKVLRLAPAGTLHLDTDLHLAMEITFD